MPQSRFPALDRRAVLGGGATLGALTGLGALTLLGGLTGCETAQGGKRGAELPKDLSRNSWSYRFTDWPGVPLEVEGYTPSGATAQTPLVFVLHDSERNAKTVRNDWSTWAEHYKFIIVAPRFDARRFPGSIGYNMGGVVDAQTRPTPAGARAFDALEPLFDTVRTKMKLTVPRYHLVGHAAGAQFVQRFLLFTPRARVEQSIVANAGWYTFPDWNARFPYGLAGAPLTRDWVRDALSRSMTLLLGAGDTDPDDPGLRRTAEAMQQGAHRLGRGASFYTFGKKEAEKLKVPFGWQVKYVQAAGIDSPAMARAAAELLATPAR